MTLAVLCPGQGGQHAAMLDLVAADDTAGALRSAGVAAGFDLAEAAGSDRRFDNAVAQPLICAVQCVTWAVLRTWLVAAGVDALLFAGYSVGELAAHGCAGSLSTEDIIGLARRRAAAMDAASGPDDGLLALLGVTRRVVDRLCDTHRVHVAIVNGDDHWILGGTRAALTGAMRDAAVDAATARLLPVRVAAHTPVLAMAAVAFRDDLASIRWTPAAGILAGIDGSLVRNETEAVDVLSRQLAETIRWSDCMDSLVERGATVCLELGPGDALSRMMRERHPRVSTRSVDDFRTLDAVAQWVVGADGLDDRSTIERDRRRRQLVIPANAGIQRRSSVG